jgi:putative ABC transport system permease protein
MSRILLVCRLAGRDLRRRPTQALLLLLAITAATATLSLGLALNGVTKQPYQRTRAMTNGPDVVAQVVDLPVPGSGTGPGAVSASQLQAQTRPLVDSPAVSRHSGPYPVASAILRFHDVTVGVQAEGRTQTAAAVDQPKVTAGRWVSPGGVVLERTFATALGVGVGDRVTLDGRSFLVTGIAVTAAAPPYPNLCYMSCAFTLRTSNNLSSVNIGLVWVTEAAARAMGGPNAPLTYMLNLTLKNPATAEAFVDANERTPQPGIGTEFTSWESIASADGLLVQDEQSVIEPGALLAALLAIASVAVLAGGRMAERTRRVGLLKAVGGTPGLVAAVLMAENLALALLAAVAGLVIGWATAPLITNPGAGLIGSAGAPSLTLSTIGLTIAAAFAVALASTLVPAIKAARTSTVSALANSARAPRRRAWLIAISATLPVPMLFGLRLVARRLRRAVLGAASVAVTSTGIIAVLAFHATVDHDLRGTSSSVGDPVVTRDSQMLIVITIVLVALAVLNAVFTAWATVLDSRRAAALARALGASPRQVTAGVAWAQVLPALPGALLGIPLGIGLFVAANSGGTVTLPPVWWMAVAMVIVWLGVAALASIPARIGTRRSVAGVLQAETA